MKPTNGPADPDIKHSEQWAKVVNNYVVSVETVGDVDNTTKIEKELRLQFGDSIVGVRKEG